MGLQVGPHARYSDEKALVCHQAGPCMEALYGDDVLLLMYWKQRPPRISAVVTPPLAGEELCHSNLPRWIRTGVPHHSGSTSGLERVFHTIVDPLVD